MNEAKPPVRKRLITGWRQLERRKTENRSHQARRAPHEVILLPPVKL